MVARHTPKRNKPVAKASGAGRRPDDLDLNALYAQAAREMRTNKGRIEAGETYAAGRRSGPEGSASKNRNRWYG